MSQEPPYRRLRAYTFDPSLATQLETSLINETVLHVPWENLERGPVGEYLEVIDYDPPSDCFYSPVDLDDPHLLAQDGHAPSEGNPQFHQQMVYGVAMKTIQNFERALGRKALWSPHFVRDEYDEVLSSEPVPRLRIYPHGLCEANAYYSPNKKALLFGYFPAILTDPGENLPGGLVFTCLSHDVVAHETTHALLDGLHRYFSQPSNPDVLAFHEAFADIVALFQHFTQPEALIHQIARTRGDLASQNLLGELAHQFGQAIGSHGALRDAIGQVDPITKKWKTQEPDPEAYASTIEPHARGAILVAAMFDAFLAIYKTRISDLFHIATGGTGQLPKGNLHPDLVKRLAGEATSTAGYLLRMAIRALDYCPPVDITFGEYLRALITADTALVPADERGYRIAIIEAFRRRGIYPREVRTLAADALCWREPVVPMPDFKDLLHKLKMGWKSKRFGKGEALPDYSLQTLEWQTYTATAADISRLNQAYTATTWAWLKEQHQDGKLCAETAYGLGLALDDKAAPGTIYRSRWDGLPSIEVHSVRSARRTLQDGRIRVDLVIELVQRRRGYLDPNKQALADNSRLAWDSPEWKKSLRADFRFRGGSTLLIDSETGKCRYAVAKNVCSAARLARQRELELGGDVPSLRATYTSGLREGGLEPFALLHRSR